MNVVRNMFADRDGDEPERKPIPLSWNVTGWRSLHPGRPVKMWQDRLLAEAVAAAELADAPQYSIVESINYADRMPSSCTVIRTQVVIGVYADNDKAEEAVCGVALALIVEADGIGHWFQGVTW